jgi:hypothetical protein
MNGLFAAGDIPAILAARSAWPLSPALAQSGDSGTLLLLCCYGLVLVAYLGLVYWVYSDARRRGNDKAGLWALLVFFTPIVGLLIYLLVGRDQGTRDPLAPAPLPRQGDDPDTRRF